MSQNAFPEKMGDSSKSPPSHLRGRRGFHKEGEGNGANRSRKGVEKFSMCRQARSLQIRPVMVLCVSAWFSHPGFMSSRFHG